MTGPTPKQRARAGAWLEKWRMALLLNEWFFNIVYKKQDQPETQEGNLLAEIDASPVYLRATIKIYPQFWQRDIQTQEHALIHELCHCITQPARDIASHLQNGDAVHHGTVTDAFETLTQRIANIAFRDSWK